MSRFTKPFARRVSAFGSLCLVAAGCAKQRTAWGPPVPAPRDSAESIVFLLGDAGKANIADPVLQALRADVMDASTAAGGPDNVAVVFLGDNIYDSGLHDAEHEDHDAEIQYLEAQIEVVRNTGVRGIFVTGNHDWNEGAADGLEYVIRQEQYLADVNGSATRVTMLPGDGCPGPLPVPVGPRVLLVALDTQWWLQKQGRPEGVPCRNGSEEDVVSSLATVLRNAGDREVMIVAHHPMATEGPHGGYFTLQNHVLPLLPFGVPIPLPVAGSLYPIARNNGVSSQDLSGRRNQLMRRYLAQAFRSVQPLPLFQAAGHEHSLQVLRGGEEEGVEYVLISGSGSKTTPVRSPTPNNGILSAVSEIGYMRIGMWKAGNTTRTNITVVAFGSEGTAPGQSWCQSWAIEYDASGQRTIDGVTSESSCPVS